MAIQPSEPALRSPDRDVRAARPYVFLRTPLRTFGRRVLGVTSLALLDVAGKVAGNTANIPQLQATAPVLGQIVEEAVVQDRYMNALTDGYGES